MHTWEKLKDDIESSFRWHVGVKNKLNVKIFDRTEKYMKAPLALEQTFPFSFDTLKK